MIPEPPATFGLWPRVKAASEWPDTDETAMAALGGAYAAMADSHDGAARVRTDAAAANWTDDAGALFVTRTGAATREAGRLAGEMRTLGRRASRFAEAVTTTKNDIRDLVVSAIPGYGALALLPPLLRPHVEELYVRVLANDVNELIANTAQGLAVDAAPGEYDRIRDFMFDEMVRNSTSPTVAAMKMNNENPTGDEATKAAALTQWAWQVRPGGDWDHKNDILNRTAGWNTFTPLPGGDGNIRYDVWSNIHYGYVGREAGFTPGELRGGADLADYVTQDRPDPGDDVAVRIGMELRDQYPPGRLRPEHITQAIEQHRAELAQHGMIGPDVK
ncbi:WXG100-like domain-containing protein [Actinophytocola sp. KF-1]